MNGNALSYLLHTKLKNIIKNFFHKPIRIIYLLLILVFFGITVYGGASGEADPERKLRSFTELTAGLNVLLILVFSTVFYSGLSTGGSAFKMADVNLIFPSPLNKRSVLFYALIQQMGTSLFVGFFVLFQYTSLHMTYNLSILGLLLIFVVYSITAFLGQTFSMFIYTFVSDSDRKKRLVKGVFMAIILLAAAYVGYCYLQNTAYPVPTLVSAVNALPIRLFPVAGWLGAFGGAVLTGQYLSAALWLCLTAAVFVFMLVLVSRSRREYYEDVIASAENMQNALSAANDGTAPEATPRHIKVGKPGIGRGFGSSVLFYKHMLENRRSSKLFVGPMSLMFIVMTIGFSLFMQKAGIVAIISFSAYIQIFSLATGRFNRELMKPYIYLIPEPPLKKMVWALMETMPTSLLEGVLIFVPVSFIMGLTAPECILCIVVRLSFAALFTAGNILIERIWGGSLSKVAGMFIYIIINLLLATPGAVLAIVLSAMKLVILSGNVTILLSLVVCNVPIALLTLFLCRNMLQNAETN